MLNNTPKDIEENGIITGEMLNEHLTRLKEKSYSFQSKQQVDSVVMETFDFTMNQFLREIVDGSTVPIRHKFLAFLEYSFVTPQRKLKFKRSGYMGKEVSSYEISTKFDIFDKNFMIFIDGKLIDCINIVPREGGIDLVMNIVNGDNTTGVSEDTFKEWVKNKTKGTIIFFSNSDFNPLITNREILNKNKKFLSLSDSGILDELDSDAKYISFITSNHLGYRSDLVDTTNKETLTKFFKDLDAGTSTERSFINIFGFRNLSKVITVPEMVDVIQIPGYIMPIPVENILIFKKTPYGKEYAEEITLKRSYPNFYHIEGNTTGESLSLLVFFSPQNGMVDGYVNELETYYNIMGEGVDTFVQAPDIIRNYIPAEVNFSISDFKSSPYDDHFEYKLARMSELADKNPEYIRDFLKDQFENTNGLYINLSNVDLTGRIRENNHQEIDILHEQTTFEGERYLITLKDISEDGKYKVNYFIDGLLYSPDAVYNRGKYNYVYIPVDKIKDDSYIEIERFRVFENVKDVVFNPGIRVNYIDVKDDFTRDNIFLVDTSTGEFISDDLYEVYTVSSDGVTKVYEVGDYTFIDRGRVYVAAKDDSLDHVYVDIHVDAYSKTENVVASGDSDYHMFDVTLLTKPKLDNLRIFNEEGRLIQSPNFDLYNDNNFKHDTEVITMLKAMDGTKYTIDYTPNSYDVVLDLVKVPNGNLIYLKDIIDKPFDLQWFDAYLNGKRLNKNNIRILSPYLIQLVNVESTLNFMLYSRRKYDDAIVPSKESKSIIDILWETDPRFKQKVESSETNSKDIETDIISDIMFFYYLEMEELVTRYLRKDGMYHINPDLEQVTDEMMTEFPRLFRNRSNIIHFSGDVGLARDPKSTAIHINPDLGIDKPTH